MSLALAGSIRVLLVRAKLSNALTYCSAIVRAAAFEPFSDSKAPATSY